MKEPGAKVKVTFDVDALGNPSAKMSAHKIAAMHQSGTAIRKFDIANRWSCFEHRNRFTQPATHRLFVVMHDGCACGQHQVLKSR